MKAYSVYGSPGTGKTTEMIGRITAAAERYKAQDICFLSHTRAAAQEAQSRVGRDAMRSSGTIHSLAFNLLNMTKPMVVDATRIKAFAESIGVPVRGGNVDDAEQIEVGDEYLAVHSLATSTFREARDIFDQQQCQGTWQQCEYFIGRYQLWKHKLGLIDFNDMLLRFIKAPESSGAKMLLVDEAQDLSPLQWEVIKALLPLGVQEVHIAGDDDQAIYIWGGADPAGMVRFEEQFDADRLVLPQSYRIPRVVHELAHNVIERVVDRVPKEYAARDEKGTLSEHSDWYGLELQDGQSTMILARTGTRKREIERHLVAECVPYYTDGGYPGPLQNKTARALRVLHALRRGESVGIDDMRMLRQCGTAKAMSKCTDTGNGGISFTPILKWDDDQVVVIPPWHRRYYSKVDVDQIPATRLMTIHASKGREADRVIVDTALTQRVVNGMVDDPASEARVFYVAVTRARQRLDVVHGPNGYDLFAKVRR